MAQNVFDASLERNNQLNRNPFDWSHVWNGTTKHGTITPVFCELVPQKHSVRINPEFGLEMMPMVFPVQTRQFARLNFFKVPLRALWKDYMDFISNFRDDLEEPYLLPDEQSFKKFFNTGTLGDYLGVPTRGVVLRKQYAHNETFSPLRGSTCSNNIYPFVTLNTDPADLIRSIILNNSVSEVITSCCNIVSGISFTADLSDAATSAVLTGGVVIYPQNNVIPESYSIALRVSNEIFSGIKSLNAAVAVAPGESPVSSDYSRLVGNVTASMNALNPSSKVLSINFTLTEEERSYIATHSTTRLAILFSVDLLPLGVSSVDFLKFNAPGNTNFMQVSTLHNIVTDEETSYTSTPFATQDKPNNLRLLAYKPRAYEAVYNAFYRDVRNDPFIVDGRPVYNKWLPTMEGGADATPYELHQCNWERDMFTTCIPSPQQGRAPLAGLTVYDAVTTNEDGSMTVKKATALVTEDGAKYGITYNVSEDGQTLETVDYEPLSDKTAVVPIRSTLDLVNSGLSIETLRMTNAYQKYLELNMRKSFTYKAIMEGRYDVNLRFDELLMPEFIGGVSRELSMNVSEQSVDQQNTADNGLYKDALGSKAGIAGVYGKSNGNIECFCDEESIVIGLLTVTPVPIYTQMLSKDWTYRSVLDHWAPEFSNIGYQPVTYKEMCPLNAAGQADISRLEDTFGYQRPWYEHVAKYDTAHGLFRSNMNGFLMTRFFKGFPELGGAFLKVDPNVVNQVFSVTEFTDKIFGYVKFNCVVQSPIPRVAIPRID